MKLEEEIQQKNFKSEVHKAVVNLYFTAYMLQEKDGNLFKSFGLTGQQYNILRILRGQYPRPATINLLIERMLNKLCDASRLVQKLKQKKMVESVPCEEDRRAVNVLITEKGLTVLKEIDPLLDQKYLEISKNLSDEEAKTLNHLIDKLRL